MRERERTNGATLLHLCIFLLQTPKKIAGWREGQALKDSFWDHHLIQHRRFSHVLRDLDYSLQTGGTAAAMLEQVYPGPGPRPLAAWMTLLGALQHADQVLRKTGAHLEFESAAWTAAFTLSLPLYSTCSTMIANGLKSAAFAHGNKDKKGISTEPMHHAHAPDEEYLSRLRAYSNLAKTAARGILAWLGRQLRHTEELFKIRYSNYEEAGTGSMMVRAGVDFHVHAGFVSFHLPLHRFLAAAILEGTSQGLHLPNLDVGPPPIYFATLLAEFPLRCLALCAQVTAGLWRRNGISIQGQACVLFNVLRLFLLLIQSFSSFPTRQCIMLLRPSARSSET